MYPEYPFYVVNSRTEQILTGAEFKQDAIEFAEAFVECGYITKVFSRAYCLRSGIDLSDANWSNATGDDIRVWPQEWG